MQRTFQAFVIAALCLFASPALADVPQFTTFGEATAWLLANFRSRFTEDDSGHHSDVSYSIDDVTTEGAVIIRREVGTWKGQDQGKTYSSVGRQPFSWKDFSAGDATVIVHDPDSQHPGSHWTLLDTTVSIMEANTLTDGDRAPDTSTTASTFLEVDADTAQNAKDLAVALIRTAKLCRLATPLTPPTPVQVIARPVISKSSDNKAKPEINRLGTAIAGGHAFINAQRERNRLKRAAVSSSNSHRSRSRVVSTGHGRRSRLAGRRSGGGAAPTSFWTNQGVFQVGTTIDVGVYCERHKGNVWESNRTTSWVTPLVLDLRKFPAGKYVVSVHEISNSHEGQRIPRNAIVGYPGYLLFELQHSNGTPLQNKSNPPVSYVWSLGINKTDYPEDYRAFPSMTYEIPKPDLYKVAFMLPWDSYLNGIMGLDTEALCIIGVTVKPGAADELWPNTYNLGIK